MRKIIYNSQNEERIDVFLVSELKTSRTNIHKLIKNKKIFVNQNIISKQNYKLKNKDQITIDEQYEENNFIDIVPFNVNLDIIYEDNDLLVVNKPSGMLVHPTSFNEQDTLVNALKFYLKDSFFYIVHRLDKSTSGLIIVAKNQNSLDNLQNQFMQQKVVKKYLSLVLNRFDENLLHFMIDEPIGHSFQDKLRMQTGNSKNPKESKTILKVLEQYKNSALVELQILTGRTHQIRVHMRHINHPVINDPLYGSNKNTTEYEQYLHSYFLSFVHPTTHQEISFEVKKPKEFEEMINFLKNETY